ncbi:4-hydroxyphenylacetate 3-monooxygenase [Leptospira fluminis]|uniref:4-hydroxyphenylacetate 3-monooxygenase n=1 Tax=Leptospira fluminis TaxID=2484979 RepID=A0A4R9GLP1_9LEPT|nr:4-hydroxyphenylacetate 3-hydroxylase N-terminal domain-containing protein [Leptospira fluminis]TGK15676.1 4-hydroxyphenylacetate 3-monooxygenase [Leptospira fluminis]
MKRFRKGSDYLEDLRDGRNVLFEGVRVENVAEHPAFRGGAGTIASLIDLHHREDLEDRMLSYCEDDGREFSSSYLIPKSLEELRKKGSCFREIAKVTGGMMARTPDFLATLLASWNAASAVFGRKNGEYAENIKRYYSLSLERNLVHSHAISDPPMDRFFDLSGDKKLTLRKVGETKDGIIVSGIKMLATLAPISDELIIYPFRPLKASDISEALAFAIPIGTEGLKLLCRSGIATGDKAFDRPLSERFDEMDSLCIFEDVLVPHERVFIDGDVPFANELRSETGMVSYVSHQTCSRTAIKGEFMLGLASLLARFSGRGQQSAIQQILGEMAANAEILRCLLVAAESEGEADRFGNFIPGQTALGASNAVASQFYSRSVEILRSIGASGLIMHPTESDLSEKMDQEILKYFGMSGEDAFTHIKILKIASDLVVSSFGGRQLLYEQFYLGAPQAVQTRFFHSYPRLKDAELLVERIFVPPRVPSF